MPVPKAHDSEVVFELQDDDLWRRRDFCLGEAKKWKEMADELTEQIKELMGEATALAVDGKKVAYYRPSEKYASVALRAAYPEMTQHYTHDVVTPVFDVELFARAHPDLAEPYRVRAFVTAKA